MHGSGNLESMPFGLLGGSDEVRGDAESGLVFVVHPGPWDASVCGISTYGCAEHGRVGVALKRPVLRFGACGGEEL